MWRGRLFGGVERASKHKTIEKCDLRMQPVEKRYFYSCKTSSFVLFSTTYIHAKKKRCFKSNRILWVGPALAGSALPGQADRAKPDPWYVQVTGRSLTESARIFNVTRRRPTQVREIVVPEDVCPAWLLLCAGAPPISSSKVRGHNVLVSRP